MPHEMYWLIGVAMVCATALVLVRWSFAHEEKDFIWADVEKLRQRVEVAEEAMNAAISDMNQLAIAAGLRRVQPPGQNGSKARV